MFLERNPRRVAENFYAATKIPSSAFSSDGKIVFNAGSHFIHNDYDIYNNLIETMVLSEPDAPIALTLTSPLGQRYTAYFINKYKYQDGFVLIGPYTRQDLARISQFEICFYNNQTLDLIGASLLRTPNKNQSTCYSLNVRRALDYIHSNYKNPISLGEMVEFLNLNKSYFCTLFKQETGKTFTTYLNQVRIEKSKRYLAQNNCSVLEVALSVGFSSQNYFTTTFKRMLNMTPVQYRRQASL